MPRVIDEHSILSNFLLPHASLSSLISLEQFTLLFPPVIQSHPQIESLYRDLQTQRARQIEQLSRTIEGECRNGIELARQVAQERARSERAEMAVVDELEMRMEGDLSRPFQSGLPGQLHTADTIIPSLKKACSDLEAENAIIENEAADFMELLTTQVGALSDLRYGKARTSSTDDDQVGMATIESLQKLEDACKKMSKR